MTSIPLAPPRTTSEIPDYLAAFTSFETQQALPEHRRKLGPERARALLMGLNRLPTSMPVVQVAGSKGKGSTVLWMEALLLARGLRPGCYLSPHLVRINERIRIDGADIDDDTLLESLIRVHDAFGRDSRLHEELVPTFFDVWTAVAVESFHTQGVTHALVEVGLGGPLDSTSAIPHDVGVLTTLDLEHSHELGDTIEAIGREKARIATRGRPFVSSASMVREVVESRGAIWLPVTGDDRVPDTLAPSQQSNLATALRALEALGMTAFSHDEVRHVSDTTLPGRLEVRGNLLLDSAHTLRSFAAFTERFKSHRGGEPGTILVALLEGKQWRRMLSDAHQELPDAQWICTRAPSPRSADPEAIASHLRELGARVNLIEDTDRAVKELKGRGRVGVTGSFYLAGFVTENW